MHRCLPRGPRKTSARAGTALRGTSRSNAHPPPAAFEVQLMVRLFRSCRSIQTPCSSTRDARGALLAADAARHRQPRDRPPARDLVPQRPIRHRDPPRWKPPQWKIAVGRATGLPDPGGDKGQRAREFQTRFRCAGRARQTSRLTAIALGPVISCQIMHSQCGSTRTPATCVATSASRARCGSPTAS